MSKIERIKELVELLNHYRDEYYNNQNSEISDFEYDQLFDELSKLEQETRFVMTTSPTQTVGYEVKSELTKVTHNHPMLSLDKTKSIDDVVSFLNGRKGVIMPKMDGLTCSLRYVNGELVAAETRGNGEIGEDILHCAKTIKNLPLKIEGLDEFVIDGEVIITYDDFNQINSKLPVEQRYKNPRNLASGSIRQLDSSIAAQRNMKFIAWRLVKGWMSVGGVGEFMNKNSFSDRIRLLVNLGFDTVMCYVIDPNQCSNKASLECLIPRLRKWCEEDGMPIDGCVIGYDDVAYGESLGATGHHHRSQLAYKFYDEVYKTTLLDIEWTLGKTGVLTPTAVFEPVEIDGTTVERASVHNLSILTKLDLHIGDTIEVYKANMIIPQVKKNVSADERMALGKEPDYILIPSTCPVCGGKAEIKQDSDSKVLICTNPNCTGKRLAQFTHFVSRKCMNIDGLSEKTLETLISNDFLHDYKDIYYLNTHRNKLVRLEGYGEKSIDNLLESIEKSRDVKLENFIAALGIEGIGTAAAKTISNAFNGDYEEFVNAYFYWHIDWTTLEDFGEMTANNLNSYLRDNLEMINELAQEMRFVKQESKQVVDNPFNGKTLCVTGKLNHFTRDSINEKITELGAQAAGSVSKKTDYLITNEQSGSSKYKKAIELNVPIITEDEFLKMIGE